MRAWTTVVVVASSESLYLKYIFEIQPTGVTNWMLGMRKKKKESRMILRVLAWVTGVAIYFSQENRERRGQIKSFVLDM